jgi:transposase
MPSVSERSEAPTAIQTHLAASFVSLELSRSIWLITSLSPGSGEKMSKNSVRAGDVAALLARFSELKRKIWLCCKDDRRRWEDGDKLDPISFMRRYRKER